ncbi:MAG: glutathione S-transferase family protein [Bacteriovoracaceae bacterium]
MYKLFSIKHSGGTIVELMLKRSGLPYEVQFFTWDQIRLSKEFGKLNPLRQVPALSLPDGTIMTESLAMALFLNEKARMNLVPETEDLAYPLFLRWSVFLVASLYPTFTFGDVPARFVADQKAQKELRSTTDDFRKKLWLDLENGASNGPWFLGIQESLIDFYLSVMMSWRPGEDWFNEHCPKLSAIRELFRKQPIYLEVMENNS